MGGPCRCDVSPRTVLYLEHAGALGGSCVSLRALLEHLDRTRYAPVVALLRPSPEMARFYGEAGLDTVEAPRIARWEHTTAEWASALRPELWPGTASTVLGWRRTARETLALTRRVRPALVHLNSAVLAPSAHALHRAEVPFVWHVREAPAFGHLGLRTALLRRALRRWPSATLFLSEGARALWGGGARSVVANEFVELARFDPLLDRARARAALGVAPDAKVVLYVGGLAWIKGIAPLLEALALARERVPALVCLMPGASLDPPRTALYPIAKALLPLVGRATVTQRVTDDLRRLELGRVCRMSRFSGDVPEMLAASDLLVFPSTEDHFARPVVEAGIMARPVVASRFPHVEEQVRDGQTGLLVPPGDPRALADAIARVLSSPADAERMGAAARAMLAPRHDAHRNAREVMRVYDEVLERSRVL